MIFCAEFEKCIFGLAISTEIGGHGLAIDDAGSVGAAPAFTSAHGPARVTGKNLVKRCP
jgi:hypothetical protein